MLLILRFLFIFLIPIPIFAIELARDDFYTNLNGWTGSNIWHEPSGVGWLGIRRDAYGEKTFTNLGANRNVEISFQVWVPNDWETTDDFNVYVNNNLIQSYSLRDGLNSISFLTSTNVSGNLTLRFNPDTSEDRKIAYINYVLIDSIDPTLYINNISDTEGNIGSKNFTVPVTLSPASTSTISVDYSTSNGTAQSGSDYVAKNGTLIFMPGETQKNILIEINGDTSNEGDESFFVTLSNSSNGVIINNSQISITIENDDAPPINNGYRDFTLRKQLYLKGNMKTIGNSVLVPPQNQSNNICSSYTNGLYYDNVGTSNNYWYLCGYQADTGTSNSTTAELNLPSGSKVIWAGIYWQALVNNTNFNSAMNIQIKKDSGTYNSVSYDTLDYLADSGKVGYTSYSAFKDITNLFTSNNWAEGNYTVANIPVHEGQVDNLGTYGAWTMVVVYENNLPTANEKFRSFSIFDGWKVVKNETGYRDVPIDIVGFYTPNRSDIKAEVSVFAAEGDKHIDNDYLKTKNYNTNLSVNLTPNNVSNQTFNSSISGNYYRLPKLINNNGIDIQSFDVGNYLAPKQAEMRFNFTSDQDTYWPSMLAFNTELYEPEICYDFSYRQNGVELDISGNLGEKPYLNAYLDDSPIEVGIYFRNKEADLAIENLSFSTNIDTSLTNRIFYDLNSTFMSAINGSNLDGPVDEITNTSCTYSSNANYPQVCTSNGNIRIGFGRFASGYGMNYSGELGSEEYQFFQFQLANTLSGLQNIDLNMSIDYYIKPLNGTAIPREGRILGEEIEICSENTSYSPIWGIFNVAARGSSFYNLKTQVAKKPFDVDLQYFEKDSSTGDYTISTPSKDINTTVIVEIFDVEPFHDIQAACANPGSNKSNPIYLNVVLNQNGTNLVTIPTQSADFYNFAIKNAAFRVWHFNDDNGVLIENFNLDANSSSAEGLYNALVHKDCIVKCNGQENSTTCYQCIKSKYSTAVCSRDNFSIRPESFDIRIHDINQTTKDVNTKIDLTEKYNYNPDAGTSPITRINLPAGYAILYDINATNHQDLDATPWYVRTLDIDHTWDSTVLGLICNDDNNYTASIGFNSSGLVTNHEYIHNQVGRYQVHLEDKDWTNVDVSKSHHISGYFDLSANSDCIQSSSTTNGSTVGCDITSSHNNSDTSHTYRNIDVTFKPYRFNIDSAADPIIFSRKLDNNLTLNNSFLYTSNVDDNNSMRMSLRIAGSIVPEGFNGSTLTNYTGDCYADDLNLSLKKTILEPFNESFRARFIDRNSTGDIITDTSNEVNTTARLFTVQEGNFTLDNNGTLPMEIYLNFDRNTSIPREPIRIQFENFDINCSIPNNCQFNGDLSDNIEANATRDLNDSNITFYFGRAYAPDQTFNGDNGNAQVYYEVYCVDCNRTSLNIAGGESVDSINWFQNTLHVNLDGNITRFESIGNVRFGGANYANADNNSSTALINQGNEQQLLRINTLPYIDRITYTPHPWLVFNPSDPNATTGDFMVEFTSRGGWGGEGSVDGSDDNNTGIFIHDQNITTNQIQKRMDW
jgi:hypothetical protein